MSDITIRPARDDDAVALERLAALDSARPLAGPALLAEVCGRPVAALALTSGRAIADPFRRTADVIELLRLRGQGLDGRTRTRRPHLHVPRLA